MAHNRGGGREEPLIRTVGEDTLSSGAGQNPKSSSGGGYESLQWSSGGNTKTASKSGSTLQQGQEAQAQAAGSPQEVFHTSRYDPNSHIGEKPRFKDPLRSGLTWSMF